MKWVIQEKYIFVSQMKIMKPHILIVVFALLFSLRSAAQDPSQPAQRTITAEEGTKFIVDQLAPKLNLNKDQKDTLSVIFLKFMDDIQKYHAETNEKVFAYMTKTRDDKVKNLLRDSTKYYKYLITLEDIKKQPMHQNQGAPPHNMGGTHNRMGGGGMNGGRTY